MSVAKLTSFDKLCVIENLLKIGQNNRMAKNDLTIDNISKLLDQKLDKKFEENNRLIFAHVDKRFDEIIDLIQQSMEDVKSILAPRIERLERKVFGNQI